MENGKNQDRKKELQRKLEEAKKARNEKQKTEKLRTKTELKKIKEKNKKGVMPNVIKWICSLTKMPDIVKQLSSFAVGGYFNWYFGDLAATKVETWLAQYMATGFDVVVYWFVLAIFVVYFGYFGIGELKEFWNGVPTVLGRPISLYTIPSGYFWQLPWPWMGFMPVSIKQKDLDIPIKKALSKDNVEIDIDALIQARVSDPYKWTSVENPDKALKTLVERNIRVYTNLIDSNQMPGQKVEFSRNLEIGVDIPVLDKDGKEQPILDSDGKEIIEAGKRKVREEKIESVPEAAEQWGYGGGIAKCIINDIRIPDDMVKANIDKKVEKAQVDSETTQQNLFLTLLGGGDLDTGREDFLKMNPEERAKNIQAERNKRKVITVDGTAGDITKAMVSGATIMKGGGK